MYFCKCSQRKELEDKQKQVQQLTHTSTPLSVTTTSPDAVANVYAEVQCSDFVVLMYMVVHCGYETVPLAAIMIILLQFSAIGRDSDRNSE
ncbi:Hypothetical predicted protein [Octopus vulgaris]|uniref:Uncharacterized protein n=1 Tax=Octopus vulgaris TaxID=6645 RepID=A0AA36BG79_OCTVU|nr:Hypothetical predicted protein [Octopus vulgaris]